MKELDKIDCTICSLQTLHQFESHQLPLIPINPLSIGTHANSFGSNFRMQSRYITNIFIKFKDNHVPSLLTEL